MEIVNRDKEPNNSLIFNETDDEFDPEQFIGSNRIPIFVIGTKMDSIEGARPSNSRASSVAEECGADEIFVVSFVTFLN